MMNVTRGVRCVTRAASAAALSLGLAAAAHAQGGAPATPATPVAKLVAEPANVTMKGCSRKRHEPLSSTSTWMNGHRSRGSQAVYSCATQAAS